MQQPQQMMPVMPSYPSNITTEQIQKYLDENKKLILAILDNQNLGKLAECAQYQALLQKNLMYLAAIADAQPPTPSMPQQMAPHPSMQQGGFFMQHPQAAAAAAAAMAQQQQSGLFPQRAPMQFNSPHQLQPQDPQMHHHQLQLQHQAVQAQMGGGLRPNSGGLYHQMQQHSETALGGGSKQDPSTDPDHHHGQGNSAADRSEEPK